MPTLAWTDRASVADPSAPVPTVLGSRLVPRRRRDVPAFLVLSMRLHRVAARTTGCLGVTLRADLRTRTFWTASSWSDPDAISSFVGSPLHRRAMTRYADRLAGSSFSTWQAPERPTWADVEHRLGHGAESACT